MEQLYLNIHTTNYCNQKCSYCIESFRNQNINKTYFNIKNIKQLKNLNFDLNISLYGGEPTSILNFEELVLELLKLDKLKNLSILTNGTGFKKIEKLPLDNRVELIISIHPEFYNEKILDKNLSLSEKINTTFKLLIKEFKTKSFYYNIYNKIKNKKFEIVELYNYTYKQKDFINFINEFKDKLESNKTPIKNTLGIKCWMLCGYIEDKIKPECSSKLYDIETFNKIYKTGFICPYKTCKISEGRCIVKFEHTKLSLKNLN